MEMVEKVRIGTRKSALAVVQTGLAADLMKEKTPGLEVELVLKQTTGDKILDKPLLEFGGKGVFVSEFEEALQKGEIDFAVHSAKDLPMELAEGLEIVGVPKRGDVRDVLVTRGDGCLEEKAAKGETIVVGTSSLRRQIQIESMGPGPLNGAPVACENLRGNVQTRLRKLMEGSYDAIILAAAGLKRLGILEEEPDSQEGGTCEDTVERTAGQLGLEAQGETVWKQEDIVRFTYLDWEEMIPAGCQGILAVEGRTGCRVNEAAERICHKDTLISFQLERRVLKLLDAGCHEPVGVCSRIIQGRLEVRGIYQREGGKTVYARWSGLPEEWEKAAKAVAEELKGRKQMGSVILTGAGPGDPGLITVKGMEALRTCDAVVYDSLASQELLKEIPPDCEKIYVGKRAGHHSMKQEEINRLLVEQAGLGRKVVRLKGGDPFVFGRGGEEVMELQKEGIPFQVIPGVTSAIAALASAGIPITHRGMSRSFHVMTGHTRENGLPEDLEEFGRLSGTLVFLMGLNHLEEICDCLIGQGREKATPAAVIQSGTLPDQKTVRGTLGDIKEKCREAGIGSPAIIVVGEAAGLHMESTLKMPLGDVKIGITGTPAFTAKLEAALQKQGARPEKIAVLDVVSQADTAPVQKCMDNLSDYTWIGFTSANGVRIFLKALLDSGRDYRSLGHLKLAVVGKGTDRELRVHGLRADYIPEKYCTEDLAQGLSGILGPNDKILIPRAVRGSRDLTDILSQAGIPYDDVPLYDVKGLGLQGEELKKKLKDLHYLTFASASGVESFLENLPEPDRDVLKEIKLVSIGYATAKALEEAGYPSDLTAREFSIPGMVECILKDVSS